MNYLMPAEWESHEATWLAWPHNKSHWPGKFRQIPKVFARIVLALREGGDKVYICVNDKEMEMRARHVIASAARNDNSDIRFFHIPTNASWSRDYGPIFVYDKAGRRVITDWIFNMWGGKYPPWDLDDAVPKRIAKIFKIPCVSPSIILEGGSIEVNGKGTLITTEQCLLNKNRNPALSRREIENYLRHYLGATNILWLKEGIVGDDTDGHIDDLARFVDSRTIVCQIENNKKDANYRILRKNYEALKKMKDQNGKPFRIIKMPMPAPVFYKKERLPASYANFYIANRAVLIPTFQCKQDSTALAIFTKLFPHRKIIEIDCVDLVWGLGTIHCSTQQMPAIIKS